MRQSYTLKGVPQTLQGNGVPPLLEVRGEVYMPIGEFQKLVEKLRAEGKGTPANPRNFAAGSLRQKDPEATRSRPLEFLAHGVGKYEGNRPEEPQLLDLRLREGTGPPFSCLAG